MRHGLPYVLSILIGCDGSRSAGADAAPLQPTSNWARDIASIKLGFDVARNEATAEVALLPGAAGLTLEIGDLVVQSVTQNGVPRLFTDQGDTLDIGVDGAAATIVIDYAFSTHTMGDGLHVADGQASGFTLLWPAYCGNLFPCHSNNQDGVTYEIAVTGIPDGVTEVYPTRIPAEAPSYQVAFAWGNYAEKNFGTTDAGTTVKAWHLPGQDADVTMGMRNSVATLDWAEQNLGAYVFGDVVGSVMVDWGNNGFGGMEHHPYWHIGRAAARSVDTHVHEAMHGWYGDGVRIECWEDFVLSEGTVTYLTGRALDVVDPSVGAAYWTSYENALRNVPGTEKVWLPETCNEVDVLAELFTTAPYIRGAFFYRALADRYGAMVIDEVLRDFYQAHVGRAARMQDMIDALSAKVGADLSSCVNRFLLADTTPTATACP